MTDVLIEDRDFKGVDFAQQNLKTTTYERCTFVDCIFSKAVLTGFVFEECHFNNCDFSLAVITETAFRSVIFKGCKLLGLHFDSCHLFLLSMQFYNCQINLASFYKLKIKNTLFKDCNMQEVDFTEADLTSAKFDNCDLGAALFIYTILNKADLSTAYNYTLDPEINKLKKAKFSRQGLAGLLAKYDLILE